MASNIIFRGTTPNVRCTVNRDISGYKVYFSVGPKARKPWFTVSGNDVHVTSDGNTSVLTFKLTQEQTLACCAGDAIAQIRAIKDDAIASVFVDVEIHDIVKDGLISW